MAENASALALGTLGIAALLVGIDPLWQLTRRLIHVTHETGHAVATLLTGHWVQGIVLIPKSGSFTERNVDFKPSKIAISIAGHPASPIAGLVLARGVQVGWKPFTVLATVLVVLTVLFFAFMRIWVALSVTVAIGVIVAVFVYLAGPSAQLGAVVALSWLLLLGGFRATAQAAVDDHKPSPDGRRTDAGRLQEFTGIHANAWSVFFILVAIAALITGARWLLTYA